MPEIFLIPAINIIEVHDAAVREWLNGLSESSLRSHLDYPFRLDRFFPEISRHAVKSANEVNKEILELLDIIDPDAVFLDISVDLIDLENKYNKRLISPLEFWSSQILSMPDGPYKIIYGIYIKDIIKKMARILENKEYLPVSVVLYGGRRKRHEDLISLYEDALEKDDAFLLQMARTVNEITSFREHPGYLWHSWGKSMAISYEGTEKFYDEILSRMKGLLESRIRDFIVRNLKNDAAAFVNPYEDFLDNKKEYDRSLISNIIEGLEVLTGQSDLRSIVIFCNPVNYSAVYSGLKKDIQGMKIDISGINTGRLLDKMKPFLQKDRILQNDYEMALDIIGNKKPDRFNDPVSILTPAMHNMIS